MSDSEVRKLARERLGWRRGREVAAQYPRAEYGAAMCLGRSSRDTCGACTRVRNHDGPHVAHGWNGVALLMWSRADKGKGV